MTELTSILYQIKVKFIDGVDEKACLAFGVFGVLQSGINTHWKLTESTPNSRMFIGIGNPSNFKRIIKYIPTHKNIHDELIKNKDIILNLYFGELIQYWYDYLSDIYLALLKWNIYHNGKFNIQSENLKIDLSLSKDGLIQNVIDSAIKNFDFLPASEKLNRVKKALSKTEEDWKKGSEYINNIRTNIQIRNIMQHNLGIISAEDLQFAGCKNFEEDHGDAMEYKTVGMKITRTPYDIEKFVDSMKLLANIII
jgi:hypothetical protein